MADIGSTLSKYTSASELSNLLESDKAGIYFAKTYLALDGVVDDYSALYALINTTINGADAEIWFKDGSALINSNISTPSNIKLKFLNDGMLKPANGVTITGSNTKIESGLHQIFDLSLGGTIAGTWDIKEVCLEWFGDLGVSDAAIPFNEAINFCKNTNVKNIKILSETLYVDTDLDSIDFTLNLKGSGSSIDGAGTKILDRRTGSTALLNYTSDARGFRIADILFDGQGDIKQCFNFEANSGWDYTVDRCTITRYRKNALNTGGADGSFNNCLFTNCGTIDPAETDIHYCIQFEGNANMQKFNNCHFEHCRFFVNTYSGFMNTFSKCKFEQSGVGLSNPSQLSPIEINKTGYYCDELSFDTCTFIPVSERAYIDELSLTALSDVPHFININKSGIAAEAEFHATTFNNCTSRTGAGSGDTAVPSGYSALLKSRAKTIINSCTFNKLSGSRYSIDLDKAIVTGNNFNFKFHDTTDYAAILPNNGFGIGVSNYSLVTGNDYNALYVGSVVDANISCAVTYQQLDHGAYGLKASNNNANFKLYSTTSFVVFHNETNLTLESGVTGSISYSFENSRVMLKINDIAKNASMTAGTIIAYLPRYPLIDYAYILARNTTSSTVFRLAIVGDTLRVDEAYNANDVLRGGATYI